MVRTRSLFELLSSVAHHVEKTGSSILVYDHPLDNLVGFCSDSEAADPWWVLNFYTARREMRSLPKDLKALFNTTSGRVSIAKQMAQPSFRGRFFS